MTVINLDAIVKNILLKRGYPLHYYLQFLVFCKDGLREIAFDEPILALRYTLLPIDQTTFRVDLPNDYQDYTRVSVRSGQYIVPLIESHALDILPNYDANFNITPYTQGQMIDTPFPNTTYYIGYLAPYWWTVNWDAFGENLGRLHGGIGPYPDTFRIDKANNQIALNQNYGVTDVLLEYISDGMDADSATHIDSYAQFAIESFALWQFKEHNRSYGESEAQVAKQDYIQQRKILTARLSDVTLDGLKRIVQANSIGVKY